MTIFRAKCLLKSSIVSRETFAVCVAGLVMCPFWARVGEDQREIKEGIDHLTSVTTVVLLVLS